MQKTQAGFETENAGRGFETLPALALEPVRVGHLIIIQHRSYAAFGDKNTENAGRGRNPACVSHLIIIQHRS